MNKSSKEKIYLRIVVISDGKNMNRHSYIFEQHEWRGTFQTENKYKSLLVKDLYATSNRYEAKLMMGLFGLNKIKKYYLYRYLAGILSYCVIEFED